MLTDQERFMKEAIRQAKKAGPWKRFQSAA